jgi:MFS transporter, AAHS family, 4-hydroxybenzoate transporter
MSGAQPADVDVVAVIDRVSLSRLQWVTIALCGIVAILDGFDTQAIAFVAPLMAKDMQIEMSAFGPVFGAGLLGLTVGALAFGPIADRWGRKPVIIVSTLMFGVFAFITPVVQSLEALMVMRFLTGLGLGGAMPNIIALTSEYSPKHRRATLVTLMFCGFPLGAVLGGLVSAQLMARYGWPVVFYLGGILPIVVLPLLMLWLPESIRFLVARDTAHARSVSILRRLDPAGSYGGDTRCVLPEQKAEGSPISQLFADGRAIGTLLLWVVFFCNLLILYFLINWLPSVLQQAGLPIERAIIATVILNAGGIVGGLTLGRLVDRRQPFGILTLRGSRRTGCRHRSRCDVADSGPDAHDICHRLLCDRQPILHERARGELLPNSAAVDRRGLGARHRPHRVDHRTGGRRRDDGDGLAHQPAVHGDGDAGALGCDRGDIDRPSGKIPPAGRAISRSAEALGDGYVSPSSGARWRTCVSAVDRNTRLEDQPPRRCI